MIYFETYKHCCYQCKSSLNSASTARSCSYCGSSFGFSIFGKKGNCLTFLSASINEVLYPQKYASLL